MVVGPQPGDDEGPVLFSDEPEKGPRLRADPGGLPAFR
jgi:hypothetical protein